jgi:hypothetical protein
MDQVKPGGDDRKAVMPGLVPGIHVFSGSKSWTAE